MKNVWVVDDDQEMTVAIGLMLELLDCKVTSFNDARSASEALSAGMKPDVVLLDINLPEVNGFDLLEYLRRSAEWKNLPVIMLSSETADVVVDKALGMGADGYLMKPVTVEELQKVMSEALQNRHSH